MRQTVHLKQNRTLIAALSKAAGKTRRWLVFLPQSSAEFHHGARSEIKALLGSELAAKFNYLVINKPGLSPRGLDSKAFESSFRRQRRVSDALQTLKAVVPARDKIYLVGYSEGAYLAPQIARLDARVEAVIMIGGGTRGWLKEELGIAQSDKRPALVRQIRRIQANPLSTEKWNGFSYATWNSYRHDSTLNSLKRLEMPMLSILGARDRVIDLKATLTDLQRLSLQKDLKTAVLPACGHSFAGHWSDVRRILADFLKGR
jgi:pimeloyl-ACP methyl ester carboxylesterase